LSQWTTRTCPLTTRISQATAGDVAGGGSVGEREQMERALAGGFDERLAIDGKVTHSVTMALSRGSRRLLRGI
jgi:hypothetical protein